MKRSQHLYKTAKLGGNWIVELNAGGDGASANWVKLEDSLTFGDYANYGMAARNTYKKLFQIRVRLGPGQARLTRQATASKSRACFEYG